jgi:hypothetical protein
MLRILVISLFVANLLLLGFQGSKPAAKTEPEVVHSATRDTGIPTIHLFSEMIEDQGLMSGSRRCFTLGPFHSNEDRDEVRLLLQEVSTRTAERRTEALVEKGYWVFMPPYASLLEANEELLSLQALGLKDIGIIYDGDWKNAISLGYFLRQENALRRKKALQERGYEPLMRVQRQTEPRFWLDYEQRPGSDLVSLDMTNRPNDFLQRSVPCPEQEEAETEQADLLAPVEVVAQSQETKTESATTGDQEEDSTAPGALENAREERVEEAPQQAVVSVTEEEPQRVAENVAEEITEDSQDTPNGDAQEAGLDDQPVQESESDPDENLEDKPMQPVGTGPADGVEDESDQKIQSEADSVAVDGTGEG